MFRFKKEIEKEYEHKIDLIASLIPIMDETTKDKIKSCQKFNQIMDSINELIKKWTNLDFEELKHKGVDKSMTRCNTSKEKV